MTKKPNPKDDNKPFTREDVHALAVSTELSEREREILYGDGPVTYEEFSDLFDKLMDDMDDYESAMGLRSKCKNVIEKHARRHMENFDPTEEPHNPVLTTQAEIATTRDVIAENFPKTHSDTEEMLAMGKRRNAEIMKEKAERGIKAATLVEQFRNKITDETTAMAVGFSSLDEWNSICDRIKYAALQGDEDAIEGIFNVQKKGGLWDVNVLGSVMKSVSWKI